MDKCIHAVFLCLPYDSYMVEIRNKQIQEKAIGNFQ